MKRLIIKPEGWPCTLAECPPGLFLFADAVGFKTEYAPIKAKNLKAKDIEWVMDQTGIDVYVADSGERFCGCHDGSDSRDLEVQPCVYAWESYDE